MEILAVLIPVALTGVITITMTVVAHEAAELLAVANGLRALRTGRRQDEEDEGRGAPGQPPAACRSLAQRQSCRKRQADRTTRGSRPGRRIAKQTPGGRGHQHHRIAQPAHR